MYTVEAVIKIFDENSLEDIVNFYTKKDLVEMYITLYNSKPLSASNKMRIAQNIHQYIYTVRRTKALLG